MSNQITFKERPTVALQMVVLCRRLIDYDMRSISCGALRHDAMR